jgi:hypothetical protein
MSGSAHRNAREFVIEITWSFPRSTQDWLSVVFEALEGKRMADLRPAPEHHHDAD